MRIVVESFKRLHEKEKLTSEQLRERVAKEIITAEEFSYITGEEYTA